MTARGSTARATALTGSRRLLSPVLLAGVVLCFFLPFFAAVSCDDKVKVSGIELATGGSPAVTDIENKPAGDSDTGRLVLQLAGPPAALAFVAAIAGGLVGLLGRGGAPPTVLVAAGVGFGALALLYLGGQLADDSDFYGGYWAALSLLASAVVVSALFWKRRDRIGLPASRSGRGAAILAVLGLVVLLTETVLDAIQRDDPVVEEFLFWSALVAVVFPVGVIAAVLLLGSRDKRGLAAGLLLGLGSVAVLDAISAVEFVASGEPPESARGIATVVIGSLLILLAAVIASRGAKSQRRLAGIVPLLALIGVVALAMATIVPYDGGGDGPALTVFSRGGDLSGGGLLFKSGLTPALPLGAAWLVSVAAVLSLRRVTPLVCGLFLALGGATALFYLERLYPFFARAEGTSPAPGAVIGLVGAALVVTGGVVGLGGPERAQRRSVAEAEAAVP